MALHNYVKRHAQCDKHFENDENEHNDYANEVTQRSTMDSKVKKKNILIKEPKHEKQKFQEIILLQVQ